VCNKKALDIELGSDETSFTVEFAGGTQRVTLPLSGKHSIYDALAAISAGIVLGIEATDAAKALLGYVPSGMRQRIVRKGGVTVIEDCYNASPDSQRAALEVLRGLDAKRRIAVLGDMKELGSMSEQAHREVGIAASNSDVDILVCCGPESAFIADEGVKGGIKEVLHFTDKEQVTQFLIKNVKDGDALLFKASRAMKLEDIIQSLYDYLERMS
jgi:UDP-N-acetylmuramoyl-tripeptide--D-alanyl-D-alanine ligase